MNLKNNYWKGAWLFLVLLVLPVIVLAGVSVSNVNSGASPSPVNVGDEINFSATWTGGSYWIFFCKSDGCVGCDATTQTDCYCAGASNQTSPFICSYIANESDLSSNNYFWFKFYNESDGSYSGLYAGANGFDVNHRPVPTSVTVLPQYAYTNATFNCSYTFTDQDGDSEILTGRTFIWYRNGAILTSGSSQTYSNPSLLEFRDNISCNVSVVDEHGFASLYVYSGSRTLIAENSPNITGVSSHSSSDSRIDEGNYVTFEINWTDYDIATHQDGERSRIYVCNDSSWDKDTLSCNHTTLCYSSFSSTSPITCSHLIDGTETMLSSGQATYYAFIVDDGDMYNVSGPNYFYINHAPHIDRVRLIPYNTDYYESLEPFNCSDVSFMSTDVTFGGLGNTLYAFFGVSASSTGTSYGHLDALYNYVDDASSPATSVLSIGMDGGYAREQKITIVTNAGTIDAYLPNISSSQNWRFYVAKDGSTFYRTQSDGTNISYMSAFSVDNLARAVFKDSNNLLCNLTNITDLDSPDDSSNITYTIRWHVNRSGHVSTLSAPDWPLITHGNTLPGDVWWCNVTLSDGSATSRHYYSDKATIQNDDGSGGLAPYLVNYSDNSDKINPVSVGDEIEFYITWDDDSDPNEEVKIYICNSSTIDRTGCYDKTLNESDWTTDKSVTLRYTVTDDDFTYTPYWILVCDDTGADENNVGGNWLCSNYPSFGPMGNLTMNHIPQINRSISINWSSYPAEPSNNDNLICDYIDITNTSDAYDKDGDNINLSYRWYVNRTGFFTYYPTSKKARILTHGNIEVGDYWKCEISASDKYSTGIPKNSSPIHIWQANWSVPSIDYFLDNSDYLNPINVGDYVRFNVSWSDLDGDMAKLYICNSSNINEAGCMDGIFYEGTSFTSSNFSVSYKVSDSDNGEITYFIRICDDSGLAWTCSDIVNGTFISNHKPNVTAIALIENSPSEFTLTQITNVTTSLSVSNIPTNNKIFFYYNVSPVPSSPSGFGLFGYLDPDTHVFTKVSNSTTKSSLVIAGNGSVLSQTLTISTTSDLEPALKITLPDITQSSGIMWYLYVSENGALYLANGSGSFGNSTLPPNVTITSSQAMDSAYIYSASYQVPEDSNLLCYVEYSDIDGQFVTMQYDWYVNRGSGFERYLAPNTNILTHGNIQIGDQWYCTATPSDGFINGDLALSESVNASIIGNSGRPNIISILDDVNPQERINVGGRVNFSLTWNDSDSTLVNVYVCNSTNIGMLGCLDGSGLHDGSSTLFEIRNFTSSNPINFSYTVKESDNGTIDYYAMVCDNTGGVGGNWKCSDIYKMNSSDPSSSSGNFTVNHPPNVINDVVISAIGTSGFFDENTSMLCNVTPADISGLGILNASDVDSDSVHVKYRWYVNRTGYFEKIDFAGSRYLSHSNVEVGDAWLCEAVQYDDYSIGNAVNSSTISITRTIPGNSSPVLTSVSIDSNATNPVLVGSISEFSISYLDNDSQSFTLYICNESYGIDISKARAGCSNFGAYGFVEENFTRQDYTSYNNLKFSWNVSEVNTTNATYFAWICDDTSGVAGPEWKCSLPLNGTVIIDHRPRAYNISVEPSSINASTNLLCTYDFSSRDSFEVWNDSEYSTVFEWYRQIGGTGLYHKISSEHGPIISQNLNNSQNTYFEKGDNVMCKVLAKDSYGVSDSHYQNSTIKQVSDAAPDLIVNVTDLSGSKYVDFGVDLYCRYDDNDPDGDKYNVTIRWFDQDGNQPLQGYDGQILNHYYNTVSSKNWTCVVNITRGPMTYTSSNTLTINETQPTSVSDEHNLTTTPLIISLASDHESYIYSQNITINVTWGDIDTDEHVIWFVCNSSNITRYGCQDDFICDYPSSYTNSTYLSCEINSTRYSPGQLTYYAIVCDDDGNCSEVVSNTTQINESDYFFMPWAVNITISPSSANIGSNLVCDYDYYSAHGTAQDTSDIDYRWYRNRGLGYELISTSPTLSNSIIGDLRLEENDSIVCSVRVHDIASYASGFSNSTPVTLSNSNYSSLFVTMSTDHNLTFTASGRSSSVDSSAYMHLFEEVTDINISYPDAGFIAQIHLFNISDSSAFLINARNITDISTVYNSSIRLGSGSQRYVALAARAFEILGNISSSGYSVMFDSSAVSLNSSYLKIIRLPYNFSSSAIDFDNYQVLSVVDVSGYITASVSEFSIYVFVYDQARPETCNGVDDDYDGAVDEGCSHSSGGGHRHSSGSFFLPPPPEENCSDGIMNQGEAGIDCGGPCPACPDDGFNPVPISDSGSINYCEDGIQNQDETGIDCGGSCKPCPTCNDGLQNQGETGVDCGGRCKPCASCNDGLQNQGETGVDCGGPCIPCGACDDGIQNQDETGVDCGGICSPCANKETAKPVGFVFFFILMLIVIAGILGYAYRENLQMIFNSMLMHVKPDQTQNKIPNKADDKNNLEIKHKVNDPVLRGDHKDIFSDHHLLKPRVEPELWFGLTPKERLKLEIYVYHELARGFTEIEIKDALYKAGWQSLPVEELFKKVHAIDRALMANNLHIPHNDFAALVSSLQNLFNQLWDEGYREDEIKSVLISKGWSVATIEHALNYLVHAYNQQFS